jgi:exodeoxyribonuclease VII small subunit
MATEKLSYSKALAELEDIVGKMEDNKFEIDELTEKVKRVAVLVKFCKEKLRDTSTEVQKIFDGINDED